MVKDARLEREGGEGGKEAARDGVLGTYGREGVALSQLLAEAGPVKIPALQSVDREEEGNKQTLEWLWEDTCTIWYMIVSQLSTVIFHNKRAHGPARTHILASCNCTSNLSSFQ